MNLNSIDLPVTNQRQAVVAPVAIQVNLMQRIFVFGCIMFSVALRFFHLGTQSLWYDEVESLRYAFDLTLQDIHPPTFYVLLNLATKIGQSEFVLRFPSAIFGILSVALVYVVGRRLFSYQVALIATFLVSISPMLVWHSQDARMYSQLLFGCLLIVYIYLRAVEKNEWKYWLFFFLAASFALYTQLYSALLLGTLGLHYLAFHRSNLKRWFIIQGAIVLFYTPWLITMITMPGEKIGSATSSGLLSVFYSYFAFLNGYSLGPTINELRVRQLSVLIPYLPLLAPIILVAIVLVVVGLYQMGKKSLEKSFLLLTWLTVPVAIAILIPYLYTSMTFNVRYVVFSVPALLLIMAYGITRLKKYYLGLVLLAIVVIYNGFALRNYSFNPRYSKEDVRQAAVYVESNAKPDDRVLVVTAGHIFQWYFRGNNPIVSNLSPLPAEELVGEAENQASSIWLVKSRVWQTDPRNEIQDLLDSRYKITDSVSFPGVEIFHYCMTDCSSP